MNKVFRIIGEFLIYISIFMLPIMVMALMLGIVGSNMNGFIQHMYLYCFIIYVIGSAFVRFSFKVEPMSVGLGMSMIFGFFIAVWVVISVLILRRSVYEYLIGCITILFHMIFATVISNKYYNKK